MIDELLGWGLRPRVLVADAGYGNAGEFRQASTERGIDYAVQVAHTITAYPLDVGRTTARQVTWRDSSRRRNGQPVPMSPRFVLQRSAQLNRRLQALLARLIGTCPTCQTRFPQHQQRAGRGP